MNSRIRIAIMAGGNSSEEVISLKSAKQIGEWLNPDKYDVYPVLVKGAQWVLKHPSGVDAPVLWDTFAASVNGQQIAFQCALIAIHGTPGENGFLQSYFEMKSIPYTTCGVLSSAITFDKEVCKRMVSDLDVSLAKALTIRRGDAINEIEVVKALNLPIFVKPNESGSSFGVTKVKGSAELKTAIESALKEDGTILMEEFIEGVELTCGLIKAKGKTLVFPVTEIVPMNDYFDYGAKYMNQVEEITPGRFSPEQTQRIQSVSSSIYDRLKCRGIVRIDYILRGDELFFLEVNTVPGMSETSIVPQQVEAMGLTMSHVFDLVIEDAMERL
jgi:D-alanine-D-alanine ligase